ncbi:MAG: threonine-phosphate decarboxylase [Janthinobacterium lividum]
MPTDSDIHRAPACAPASALEPASAPIPAPALNRAPASAIHHGGDLHGAICRFGIPRERWLDLSTGINPRPYPVTMPPPEVWQRLPDDDDGLDAIAARYFTAESALPLAGSQAAIRTLPFLLPPGNVAIADLTYGEYAPAFARAGHTVRRFHYRTARDTASGAWSGASPTARPGLQSHARVDAAANAGSAAGAIPVVISHAAPNGTTNTSRPPVAPPTEHAPSSFLLDGDDPATLPADIDYLVVVNPNNPTTDLIPAATLLRWRAVLAARGGLLIVDEAFIDATPAASVASACGAPGLLVLRSVGKFFGLAGTRAGFALGPRALLDRLRLELGAWSVNGPARHAVRQALQDATWQTHTRLRIDADSARLRHLLMRHGLDARATALFAWTPHPDAAAVHARLAESGVWTRLFSAPAASAGGLPSLRFGLPADDVAAARLDQALHAALPGARRARGKVRRR